MNLDQVIRKFRKIAKWAAQYAVDSWTPDLAVKFKDGDAGSPVTDIDMAIAQRIQKEMGAMLGGFFELIEEEHVLLQKKRVQTVFRWASKTRGYVFTADPVDGTKGYIANNDDWGMIFTIIHMGKVIYTLVINPKLGQRLEIGPDDAIHLRGLRSARSPWKVARLVRATMRLAPVMEQAGLKVEQWHSAVGMAIALASRRAKLVSFPHQASLWDVAPALHIARILGLKVFFADNPRKLVTLGPSMFKRNWSLKADLIVATEEARQQMIAAMAS